MTVTEEIIAQEEIVVIIDTSDYSQDPDGINTNLLIASSKGYTTEIHRLMRLGADINTTDLDGVTPLIYAVANNHITTAKAILSYEPDLEKITISDESALLICSKDNRTEMAEILIRAGADINQRDSRKVTSLQYASIYGYFYFVDLLLYYGADIELSSIDGNSPLLAAAWAGNADICDLLLQYGANPDIADNKGFTPLITAAQNNDTLTLELLLKSGADQYIVNKEGCDALGMAVRSNSSQALDYLISRYDINKKKAEALSPLIIATKYGRPKFVQALIDKGFRETGMINFDRVRFNLGLLTSGTDIYMNMGMLIKEPLYKLIISAGIDFKPTHTRILVKESETSFSQYFDKRYLLYAGAGKEFTVAEDSYDGTLNLDLLLNFGYVFTEKYPGTEIKPPDSFKILPAFGLRWNKNRMNVFTYYQYYSTGNFKAGPHWFKAGIAFDLYFDKSRPSLKKINWY